jgi:hypothetical protein
MMSRMEVHWLNTSARLPWSRSRASSPSSTPILALCISALGARVKSPSTPSCSAAN